MTNEQPIKKAEELKNILYDTDRLYNEIVELCTRAALRGETSITWVYPTLGAAYRDVLRWRYRNKYESYLDVPSEDTYSKFDKFNKLKEKLESDGFKFSRIPDDHGHIKIYFA
jgi:hypothetical protein